MLIDSILDFTKKSILEEDKEVNQFSSIDFRLNLDIYFASLSDRLVILFKIRCCMLLFEMLLANSLLILSIQSSNHFILF